MPTLSEPGEDSRPRARPFLTPCSRWEPHLEGGGGTSCLHPLSSPTPPGAQRGDDSRRRCPLGVLGAHCLMLLGPGRLPFQRGPGGQSTRQLAGLLRTLRNTEPPGRQREGRVPSSCALPIPGAAAKPPARTGVTGNGRPGRIGCRQLGRGDPQGKGCG